MMEEKQRKGGGESSYSARLSDISFVCAEPDNGRGRLDEHDFLCHRPHPPLHSVSGIGNIFAQKALLSRGTF